MSAALPKMNFVVGGVTRQAGTSTGLAARSRPRVSLPTRTSRHREVDIGLRNFWIQTPRCRQQQFQTLHGLQRPPAPHRPRVFTVGDEEDAFSESSSTGFSRASPSTHAHRFVKMQQHLNAPKRSQSLGADDVQLQRYDWRKRATSRIPRLPRDYTDYDKPPPVRRVKAERHSEYKSELRPRQLEYSMYMEHLDKYSSHFLPAIEAELMESEKILKERLSTWGLERLEEEGYCLTQMNGYWLSRTTYGKPTAAFSIGAGIKLHPDHKFEKGCQALLTKTDPLKESPIRGSVVQVTETQIFVCFDERFVLNKNRWRMDVGKLNIVFERMKAAISTLRYDPERYESGRERSKAGEEWVIPGTHLRDVLLKSYGPGEEPVVISQDEHVSQSSDLEWEGKREKRPGWIGGGAFDEDMRIQSWVKRYSLPVPMVMPGDPVLSNMNTSQTQAIASMLGNRLSLVQGPPGTGKTKTIIETIKLLKVHFQVPHPLLVCTYTNVAVDNLVEGLAAAGVKPLRVGSTGSVRSSLLQHSLDEKMEQHHLHPKLVEKKAEVEELKVNREDLEGNIRGTEKKLKEGTGPQKRLEAKLQNMKRALVTLVMRVRSAERRVFWTRQTMLRDITEDADVICTTCITSVSSSLNVVDFPVVFLDEASMATEPVSLIPLMKGAKHIALIGDHKQLPPVIVSQEAQSLGLGVSLFERLTREGVVPSVMLDIQYRMHPAISNFPSNEFYLGTLRDGTVDASGNVSTRLDPPKSVYLDLDLARLARLGEEVEASAQVESEVKGEGVVEQGTRVGLRPSVIFLDHGGDETMKDRSRVNHTEAHIIASVVIDLLLCNPDLQGKDIGIIAPYVAQISLLTRMFNTDAKYKARFSEVLGDTLAMQLAHVEIKTVDGFEGREKEVIVFSTVRNNRAGNIGFLADKRRLNVGLTRAKRALFVVGSIQTLKEGKLSGGMDTAGASAGKGVVRVGKGAESWRRYAEFLMERGLVLSITAALLNQMLHGETGVMPKDQLVVSSMAEYLKTLQ